MDKPAGESRASRSSSAAGRSQPRTSHQRKPPRESALRTSSWRVSVRDTQVRRDWKGRQFTVYLLQVQHGDERWQLHKRYSSLLQFYKNLCAQFAVVESLPFPAKTGFRVDHLAPDLVEQRRAALHEFLQKLSGIASPELQEHVRWWLDRETSPASWQMMEGAARTGWLKHHRLLLPPAKRFTVINYDRVYLYEHEEDAEPVDVVTLHNFFSAVLPRKEKAGVFGWVLKSRSPRTIADVSFSTDTARDRDEWLTALHTAMDSAHAALHRIALNAPRSRNASGRLVADANRKAVVWNETNLEHVHKEQAEWKAERRAGMQSELASDPEMEAAIAKALASDAAGTGTGTGAGAAPAGQPVAGPASGGDLVGQAPVLDDEPSIDWRSIPTDGQHGEQFVQALSEMESNARLQQAALHAKMSGLQDELDMTKGKMGELMSIAEELTLENDMLVEQVETLRFENDLLFQKASARIAVDKMQEALNKEVVVQLRMRTRQYEDAMAEIERLRALVSSSSQAEGS